MKNSFIILLGFALCIGVSAQQTQPAYRVGLTLWGPSRSGLTCPIFVGGVGRNSPAAQAGIQPGDRLLTADGVAVTSLADAANRLSSASPGPVTVAWVRGETPYTATVQREDYATLLKNDGLRQVSGGMQVDLDATGKEIAELQVEEPALVGAMKAGDSAVVFPDHHYPANKQLYYPGFEAFVWDKGTQITVGGIEDGPARRSGVRWGDRILTVNGIDPHGKSIADIEALLSSSQPAPMVLTISRAGKQKTFSFTLEKASDVLRENRWQVKDGRIVPLWVQDQYLPCFED